MKKKIVANICCVLKKKTFITIGEKVRLKADPLSGKAVVFSLLLSLCMERQATLKGRKQMTKVSKSFSRAVAIRSRLTWKSSRTRAKESTDSVWSNRAEYGFWKEK
ncbi:hypothetical protein NPIL_41871 [Nephila pilipes]|uniref:Uncharacterized protein n=1 Tax=Nephila pilipes TaxID=299642 RepID=A0A8X6NIY5_NEPPI|nr:hypothetical protein NPIL_41871 [Nephila pilipes]